MTGSHGCSGSIYTMIHSCQVRIALKLINNKPQHDPPKKKKKISKKKGNVTLLMKMARAAFWLDRRLKNKDVTWQQVRGGSFPFHWTALFFFFYFHYSIMWTVFLFFFVLFFFKAIVDRRPRNTRALSCVCFPSTPRSRCPLQQRPHAPWHVDKLGASRCCGWPARPGHGALVHNVIGRQQSAVN